MQHGDDLGDDLPVLPAGDDVADAGARHRPWPGWVLPVMVAVVAFGAGLAVGRAHHAPHQVVVSNPCPETKEVSFFAGTTGTTGATGTTGTAAAGSAESGPGATGTPPASAVFTMTVPPYSARVVPAAGRLAPGWTYVVPLPNTRPLGGRFQGQINRGDLATGELWFPSDLCDG